MIVTRDGETPKKAVAMVKRYDGTTKEVELVTDPEIFTFAEDDKVDVIATGSPAALWLGGSP